jgi:hypothetical protein
MRGHDHQEAPCGSELDAERKEIVESHQKAEEGE